MLEKYHNKETHTITLPTFFNSLLTDLPHGTKIIIFEENIEEHLHSKFNQPVDNLPSSLTHSNIWMAI